MIDYILLQPEGVLPIEGAGGIAPQALAFLDHPAALAPPRLNFDNSFLGDEVTPPPRPRFNFDTSLLCDEIPPPPLPK